MSAQEKTGDSKNITYRGLWSKNGFKHNLSKPIQFLRLAVISLLRARARDFSAHFALKCASFCKMNVGTSKRSPCSSTGFTDYKSVSDSNRMAERRLLQTCSCLACNILRYNLFLARGNLFVTAPFTKHHWLPPFPLKDVPAHSSLHSAWGSLDAGAAGWVGSGISSSFQNDVAKHFCLWWGPCCTLLHL